MKWYAVHTEAGKEPLANLWLGRRGFETYFPYEKIRADWKPNPKNKRLSDLVNKRASIPRYIFVWTTPDRFGLVNSTMGVSTLVFAPGGEPFPIPDRVIEGLRLGLEEKRRRQKPAGEFPGDIGDIVRGREGWLHWGLFAQIVRISGLTVDVKMMMLGSAERVVTVPARSVEVVEGMKVP